MEMSSSSHQFKIPPKVAAEAPSQPPPESHPEVLVSESKDVWNLLLALRFVNALLVWTFFQPDEYFQSLEPAWQMAFGEGSGAWITWEWEHQLRSSLHPAMFAALYYTANKIMVIAGFFPQFRAMILSVLPNIAQGVVAAAGDFYTWRLAEKIFGRGSNNAWAVLAMTALSPWQWFCSTRTFSNSLEMTLTITALYFWPWEMTSNLATHLREVRPEVIVADANSATKADGPMVFRTSKSIKHLRISLLFAGTAAILRPTNPMIWIIMLQPLTLPLFKSGMKVRASQPDYVILIREAILCGSIVLATSFLSDYLYYGAWTFPAFHFIRNNVKLDLASFYGRNDWHYYFSQGLPLLLTGYTPFALIGIFHAISLPSTDPRHTFVYMIIQMIAGLSAISHKEVRFIYPLLPLLHILAAPSFTNFLLPYSTTTTTATPPLAQRRKTINTFLAPTLLIFNLTLAAYATLFHQRGVVAVLPHLRHLYEAEYLSPTGIPFSTDNHTIIAFLMPCHSTAWRTQLYHRDLSAWALTCTPPISLPPRSAARAAYRDEADRFYDDMAGFLSREVGTEERPWARYVVGFVGIEEVLREAWAEEARKEVGERWVVLERWRGWNSHVHDDGRRRGDVVVWEMVGPVWGLERVEESVVAGVFGDGDEGEDWGRKWPWSKE